MGARLENTLTISRRFSRRRACRSLLAAVGLALLPVPLTRPVEAARLPEPRLAPSSLLIWPVKGPLTARFGETGPMSPRGHVGLDIAPPAGTPVRAAASGVVGLAGPTKGQYGTLVVLLHDAGLQTVYAHLGRLVVQAGAQVSRGDLIGYVGNTGLSTGPHLHFEVRQGGERKDPLAFLA